MLKEISITKLVFIFSLLYATIMIVVMYSIYPVDEFLSRDAVVFHNIAVHLRHYMETGIIDLSITKNDPNPAYRYFFYYGPQDHTKLLSEWFQQFPAVLAAVIYYIFRLNNPIVIVFTNILVYSAATTLLYSCFLKITKNNFSALLAICIVSLFPCNLLSVAMISKGIYYYFSFSLLCFALTTRKKTIFLLISFSLLFISRPYYFLSIFDYHALKNINFLDFSKSPIASYFYTKLDALAYTLIKIRNDYTILNYCHSNFDYSTLPNNGRELLEYIPTGFLIGLFKPYPYEWFDMNKGLIFFVASIEMIFIYAGLFLFPFSLYQWRKSKEIFIISIICLLAITIYGTVSYNLGYLYRVRFIFIGTLAGIGLMYVPVFISFLRKTYDNYHSSKKRYVSCYTEV